MWHQGKFIPALDIDDQTGQLYSNGLLLGPDITTLARTSKVILQPSDITTLKATPVTLVPALGANYVIMVDHISLYFKFATTPYSGQGTNDLSVYWLAATTADPYITFSSSGFLNKGLSQVSIVAPSIIEADATAALNQPLMFAHAGGVSEFSAGDGTLTVITVYRAVNPGLS